METTLQILLTLCIARESKDWHPTGSSAYEQDPTFRLMYNSPPLNGSLLSPDLHQGFSLKAYKTTEDLILPKVLKENLTLSFDTDLQVQALWTGASIWDHKLEHSSTANE